MKRHYTNRRYLDALERRVLIFDGAMGTSLQKMELSAKHFGGERTNGCNDYLVITYPEAVEQVHRSFLEAGVDAIETDTFRANRITLAEYGLEERVLEINRAAAQLARRLADEYSTPDRPRFVAGSMGPSGKLPSMDDGGWASLKLLLSSMPVAFWKSVSARAVSVISLATLQMARARSRSIGLSLSRRASRVSKRWARRAVTVWLGLLLMVFFPRSFVDLTDDGAAQLDGLDDFGTVLVVAVAAHQFLSGD